MKPPRTAYAYYVSPKLAGFFSDEIFNQQYRVPEGLAALADKPLHGEGRAAAAPDVDSGWGTGGQPERLMTFKGFCRWFAALPLAIKAGVLSCERRSLEAKCPRAFRDLQEVLRTKAQQKLAQDPAGAGAGAGPQSTREMQAARIDEVLRVRAV